MAKKTQSIQRDETLCIHSDADLTRVICSHNPRSTLIDILEALHLPTHCQGDIHMDMVA